MGVTHDRFGIPRLEVEREMRRVFFFAPLHLLTCCRDAAALCTQVFVCLHAFLISSGSRTRVRGKALFICLLLYFGNACAGKRRWGRGCPYFDVQPYGAPASIHACDIPLSAACSAENAQFFSGITEALYWH